MSSIINIKGIHKRYGTHDAEVHALKGIDLIIEAGDFVAIMGQSGSGKSTLMNIIGCLELPDSGIYELNQQNIASLDRDKLANIRNETIGFVFQSFNLLPRTSALENIETPLIYAGISNNERKRRSLELLQKFGLESRKNHFPNQLSGGQQQRIAIARALINNPTILLADEPTGNLDTATGEDVMDLLESLNEEGLTIILITHEHEVADRAKRKLIMRDGKLEE